MPFTKQKYLTRGIFKLGEFSFRRYSLDSMASFILASLVLKITLIGSGFGLQGLVSTGCEEHEIGLDLCMMVLCAVI